MTLKFSKCFALICVTLFVSGCATPYVPPKPLQDVSDISKSQATPDFYHASGSALPFEEAWWVSFEDPILTRLIKQALNENKQLEIAEANIEIARSGLNRAELEKSYDFNSNAGLPTDRNARFGQEAATSFVGGLSARWEWDAFGRIASAIKASELSVEAAEQARQDVAVTVASETALAYLDLRGAQARLEVAQDNANIQSKSLSLLNDLLENGRATQLDVSRAEAQYRTTLGSLPQFQATIDSALNRLAVLTGISASLENQFIRMLGVENSDIPELKNTLLTGSPDGMNAKNEVQRRDDLIKAAEASRTALELAQLRFDEGLDDFLDVLEAQRTLLENEDRLTQSRLETTRLAILTYRELGGVTPL